MIVYIATNKINGKMYVGQTIKTFNHRKLAHINSAKNNSDYYFHRAIRKYGFDNFKWEVIRICDSIESLNAFEEYYILYYGSMSDGYNLKSGGLNNFLSDKTKRKISKAMKGLMVGKNGNMYGKRHTDESKKKMGRLGRIVSKETREKLRQFNLGKKLSEEHKNKIKEARLKYWKSLKEKNNGI